MILASAGPWGAVRVSVENCGRGFGTIRSRIVRMYGPQARLPVLRTHAIALPVAEANAAAREVFDEWLEDLQSEHERANTPARF